MRRHPGFLLNSHTGGPFCPWDRLGSKGITESSSRTFLGSSGMVWAVFGMMLCREVPNGFGADGVGAKFPIFPVNCSRLPVFQENRQITKKNEKKKKKTKKNDEKRRKTKKNEKNGKIPPTPSTPTPLRTSQLCGRTLVAPYCASHRETISVIPPYCALCPKDPPVLFLVWSPIL